MHQSSEAVNAGARRHSDTLLRSVMISLFAAGILAICALWTCEAHFGLLDELSRAAYPLMIAVFIVSAALLQRWPRAVPIARWAGFLVTVALLGTGFLSTIRGDGALIDNYPFISLLMWFPLAYAIALLMLDTRHAPWAAGAIFVFVAALCAERLLGTRSPAAADVALIVNLLASHLVLVACLGGLVKFKQALVKANADSHHLQQQASTDPLTGLANRRHGLEMLRRAAAHDGPPRLSAVIVCDIDHFKAINDHYGHDAGDQVVVAVARALQNSTRGIDTVVRWGGDEFLIVVPDVSREALAELAERLRTRAADAIGVDPAGSAVSPQLSVGVATRVAGETLGSWIKRADQALYQAKAGGRNRCVFAPENAGGPTATPSGEWPASRLDAEDASAA